MQQQLANAKLHSIIDSLEHLCVLPNGGKNILLATFSSYDIQKLRMVDKNDFWFLMRGHKSAWDLYSLLTIQEQV